MQPEQLLDVMQRAALSGLLRPFANAILAAPLPPKGYSLKGRYGEWMTSYVGERTELQLDMKNVGCGELTVVRSNMGAFWYWYGVGTIDGHHRHSEGRRSEYDDGSPFGPLNPELFANLWLTLHRAITAYAQANKNLEFSKEAVAILTPPRR